jgi:hypothetical protein
MTPTRLKWGLVAIVVVGAAIVLVLQYQKQQQLRSENELLRQQIAQLSIENNNAASKPASESKPAADGDLNELLRLRSEVGMLRSQTNQLAKLQEQNRQLQQTIAAVPQNQNSQQAKDPQSPEEHAFAIQQLTTAKQSMLGMIVFAADHNGQFPADFGQATSYFINNNDSSVLTNLSRFEIVYQGSQANISNLSSAIVVRSIQPWSAAGRWFKAYGFADGHAEIHTDPTGNFDAWEQQHVAVLKNQ